MTPARHLCQRCPGVLQAGCCPQLRQAASLLLGHRDRGHRIEGAAEGLGSVKERRGVWHRPTQHWTCPLTSFSPQILLIMELEAGLEEGPRTPTTPLGRIWHTVGTERRNCIRIRPVPTDRGSSTCLTLLYIHTIYLFPAFPQIRLLPLTHSP